MGNEFVAILWDQAFKGIAEKQKEIMQKHGPGATAHVGELLASTQSGVNGSNFQKLSGHAIPLFPGRVEFMSMFWSHGKIAGGGLLVRAG